MVEHSAVSKSRPLKRLLQGMFEEAYALNRENILSLCQVDRDAVLLDLGCDDGVWTKKLSECISTKSVCGVEVVTSRAEEARLRGVDVTIHDLSVRLPFADASFDVVHANQVIEHVPSIDLFTSEVFRVLKKGGYAIISTENASSWHNIFALMFGWQMFSLTNLSALQLGIGNPMAIHRSAEGHLASWTHKVIFSFRGLSEFLICHGFRDVQTVGAGYYPLPARFGRVDPRHAHFITVRAFKK